MLSFNLQKCLWVVSGGKKRKAVCEDGAPPSKRGREPKEAANLPAAELPGGLDGLSSSPAPSKTPGRRGKPDRLSISPALNKSPSRRGKPDRLSTSPTTKEAEAAPEDNEAELVKVSGSPEVLVVEVDPLWVQPDPYRHLDPALRHALLVQYNNPLDLSSLTDDQYTFVQQRRASKRIRNKLVLDVESVGRAEQIEQLAGEPIEVDLPEAKPGKKNKGREGRVGGTKVNTFCKMTKAIDH